DTEKPLLKDSDGEDVDVHTYRLISWQCKKQTVVATSSTEAEYSNNVTRLQALVDKKKVVITKATIRDALRLDDVEGVDCLPNEDIFTELARRKFNFSKYIFESLVRNVDSSSKFYMYPKFIQLIIQNQLGKGFLGVKTPLFEGMLVAREIEEQGNAEEQVQDDVDDAAARGADTAVEGDVVHETSIPSPTLPTPPPQQSQDLPSTSQVQRTLPQSPLPQPPPQAQPQATDFPMSLLQEALDVCAAFARRVEHLEYDKVAQALEIPKLKRKERMIAELDRDEGVALMDDEGAKKKAEEAQVAGDDQVKGRQAEIYKIDMDHVSKVLSMQEDEPKVQKVVDVVTTAKLITEVVTAASESVTTVSITIAAAEPQVLAATITAVPKDKGKGIMVEEPKPMKKKQQVEMDEEYARKLHEELNKDIDWDVAIDHVKKKAKEDPPDGQAQVWKNQRTVRGQARVKSWKLLESCGVHIITFITTQLILLVERRYLLLRFTLDQLLNVVRLRVEEQSEMSLELLRKHHVFNAAGEELSASMQKLMLLD
nr:hypothetical protein [Tanacetum cinerariifolium]